MTKDYQQVPTAHQPDTPEGVNNNVWPEPKPIPTGTDDTAPMLVRTHELEALRLWPVSTPTLITQHKHNVEIEDFFSQQSRALSEAFLRAVDQQSAAGQAALTIDLHRVQDNIITRERTVALLAHAQLETIRLARPVATGVALNVATLDLIRDRLIREAETFGQSLLQAVEVRDVDLIGRAVTRNREIIRLGKRVRHLETLIRVERDKLANHKPPQLSPQQIREAAKKQVA